MPYAPSTAWEWLMLEILQIVRDSFIICCFGPVHMEEEDHAPHPCWGNQSFLLDCVHMLGGVPHKGC